MKRRNFMAHGAGLAGLGTWTRPALAKRKDSSRSDDGLITDWNDQITASIAAASAAPTVAARALSMVYEAVYNAWACYDTEAAFSLPHLVKMPAWGESADAKAIAVSHAAHGVLLNLFPTRSALFSQALADALIGRATGTAAGVAAMAKGQMAAQVLLLQRASDGSNQQNGYADTSGYLPINVPALLSYPSGNQSANGSDLPQYPARWQPLRVYDNDGSKERLQRCLTPHWGQVTPFALSQGSQFRPVLGSPMPTQHEMLELIRLSAKLSDEDKVQVDYWAANPGTSAPAGMWSDFAALISEQDGQSLDEDVKLFFTMGQAVHDAGIAAWDTKRAYDTGRPITVIRNFYRGQMIRSWAGPGLGTQWIPGEQWHPYQRAYRPTPAFAEFVSGHSTFSAVAATAMAGLRGDKVKFKFVFPANSIGPEPTAPAQDVKLKYNALSDLADDAGYSRRLGGIHFERGDLKGRELGRRVGQAVLARCQSLFNGCDIGR